MQAIQAKLQAQIKNNEKALGKLLKMAPSPSRPATPSMSSGTPPTYTCSSKTEEPKQPSMPKDKVGTIVCISTSV